MRQISESAVSLKDFAGLFFALAAVGSAVILLFTYSREQEDADMGIEHTRTVYRDSQQLLVSSAEADTNARNYIMTKNPKYLALYKLSKVSLQKEVRDLINLVQNPLVHKLVQSRLAPDLDTFLLTSDQLVKSGEAIAAASNLAEAAALQRQESAGETFNATLEAVQVEQLKILQKRKDTVLDISARMAWLRAVILMVAFVATLFSIFTLQAVMKKDRKKIESLEAAFEQTQQAQQAASEALAEVRKSNELKTQFMSNISHEIRTPMTGILGMADLLSAHNLDQPAKNYAQVLLNSAQQLLSVLNDLLNFSQLQRSALTLDRKPFAIRQTIKDVTSLADHVAREKNLTITVLIDKAVPPIVIGDEDKIRQVIVTFVANSLKFTKDGGVQIAVQCADKNQIKVAVIDTGIGIGAQDLEKLFLPFVQVDGGIRRTHDGSGLSLTIAKHLVEMMAGQIGVLSESGGGSIFWFTFTGADPNE
jgi:signal transduction histidine kinase